MPCDGSAPTRRRESIDDLLAAIGAGKAKPFDAVLDLVSDGETLEEACLARKQAGTLVTTIHVADETWFAQHGIEATNIDMAETPQSSPEGLGQLARMVADRTLTVVVAAEKAARRSAASPRRRQGRQITG